MAKQWQNWQKRLHLSRVASVAGCALVRVDLVLHSRAYDGGHEALSAWWGKDEQDEGLTLFDSLAELLREFSREQRCNAMAADPEGFARAFNIEKHLGRLVSSGDLVESLLQEKGLGSILRLPSFDGRALRYQVFKPAGLNAPATPEGRVHTLFAVEAMATDGVVQHEVLAQYGDD